MPGRVVRERLRRTSWGLVCLSRVKIRVYRGASTFRLSRYIASICRPW